MDILEVFRNTPPDTPPPGFYLGNSTWSPAPAQSMRLEDLNYFTLHPVLTFSYLTIMGISTVLGLVGNVLVIGAVLVHPKLRTKANVYILNLAIADSNIAYFVQVFSIVGVTMGYSFFMDKPVLCHFIASVCLISCSCSLWNMAAIAVNRYICICKRNWYEKIFNSWCKCILIAVLLWIICTLLELPNYFDWGGHTFDAKTMACSYDRTADYSYTVFLVMVTIAPPLVVVLICYAKIFTRVQTSRREIQKVGAVTSGSGAKNGSWSKSELQLAKTLFIIFIVFLCCWSPYAILVLIDIHDRFPKVVYVVVMQMAHTNSSLNSIIYAANNKDFRDGYLRVIFFWRKFDREGKMIPREGTAKKTAAAPPGKSLSKKGNDDKGISTLSTSQLTLVSGASSGQEAMAN